MTVMEGLAIGTAEQAGEKLLSPERKRPLGLKPTHIFNAYAALKGRSSTVVQTFLQWRRHS